MFSMTRMYRENEEAAAVIEDTSGEESTVSEEESAEELSQIKASEWEPKVLKINGKEKVFSTKAEWEAAAEKYTAIGLAANEKFTEAKKLHAEAQEILDTAKNAKSAISMLQKAGYEAAEIKSILEAELTSIYKREDMSPEEIKKQEELQELEKYREDERKRAADAEKSKLEAEELKFYEEVETQLVEALSASKLPKNPILGKFALQYMAADEARGLEPDARRAVRLVEQELPVIFQGLLSSMDVDTRKLFLGKGVLDSLRSDAVQQVKKAEAPFSKSSKKTEQQVAKPSSKEKEEEPDTHIRAKDFRKRIHGF